LIGPEIATRSKDLFAPVLFAGSFLAISVLAVCTILTLAFLDIPTPTRAERAQSGGRSFGEIARQPIFIAAVANGIIGYAIMSFVMTASPIAAVGCGLSAGDAAGIIRFHLIGMFAPAFFTGALISRYGSTTIALTGTSLLLLCGIVALSGTSKPHFWVALALLGFGWNFMFVAGTTMLTQAYRPEERAKVQGLNEFLIAGSAALGSLASAGVYSGFGWDGLNLGVMPLLLVCAGITAWYGLTRRAAARAAAA
jgi:predicted MFS family arabinose efflux permease